jgi:flagella basal body P-ring formation protein FlgA
MVMIPMPTSTRTLRLLSLALAAAGAASMTLSAQTPAPAAVAATPEVMSRAIADAVVARVGAGAEVTVRLTSAVAPNWTGDPTSASLDPAARLGAPIFVTFFNGPGASLRVSADVHIVADYVRASHTLLAGQTIGPADVTPVRDAVPAMPLRHLPTAAEVLGARTIRRVSAGDILQAGFVATPPVVQMGEPVTAIARIGDIEVAARFVAEDNGRIGDLIRIVNPDTKRTLRARIIKAGTVEVFNER